MYIKVVCCHPTSETNTQFHLDSILNRDLERNRLKVFLEVVLEPAIGVEAHKVVDHNLELMEVVHEAVSVGFTADCQVPTDFLTSLSIASQLFVPGCQQGVCYFVFVDFPGFCGLITPCLRVISWCESYLLV